MRLDSAVRVYGIHALEIAEIIEWLNTLEEVGAFISEVRGDEPELA